MIATAEALNVVGYSTPSTANTAGADVRTKPLMPSTAPSRNSLTTESQIVIDYSNLVSPDNGGSTILSLHL